MEYPEINDDFTQEHEGMSLVDYREKLHKDLVKQQEMTSRRDAGKKVLETLMAKYDFEVPEGILEGHLFQQYQKAPEFNDFLTENPEILSEKRPKSCKSKSKRSLPRIQRKKYRKSKT